jgi:hypothetical protein
MVVLVDDGDATVLIGEVGGVSFNGQLPRLRQLLIEIDNGKLLLGHVQVGVFDAHPVLLSIASVSDRLLGHLIRATPPKRTGERVMVVDSRLSQAIPGTGESWGGGTGMVRVLD